MKYWVVVILVDGKLDNVISLMNEDDAKLEFVAEIQLYLWHKLQKQIVSDALTEAIKKKEFEHEKYKIYFKEQTL